MKKRTFLAFSTAALAPLGILHAKANYPNRPITVVVPFGPGGGGDIVGRIWAKHMTAQTGANVIVENKSGAGGLLGASHVARSQADGYTLLLGTSGTQIIAPAVALKPPYDAIQDFELVSMVCGNPTCIAINPKVPANNLKEFIALAKANPGKYSYGSAGAGSITNLTGEVFKYQAGNLKVVHVSYKGGGPAMQDLIAGHIPMITPILTSGVLAQHRAGKARILCVNNETRLQSAPDIPTAAEAGVPDMNIVVFSAIFAPAHTSTEAIDMLKAASKKILASAEFLKDIELAGGELISAADHSNYYKEEVTRWNKLIKTIGFKV